MSNIIEKEIFIFLRRFIYSSIFVYLRKNIDKYNQWKHLSFSFAVLVAVNCVISILCFIIFPVGIMSSLVISFVLFIIYWYKRINKLKKIGNTKNSKYWNDKQFWYGLTGWQFEEEVADVFEKNGYKTEVTQGSGDGGVDIIMEKDGLKYIVQCKRYNGHKVTPEQLRALWGVMDDNKADFAIMVATDGITDTGRDFVSNKSNYKVLTLDDIIEMSINHKTSEPQNPAKRIETKREYNNGTMDAAIVFGVAFAILLVLYCFGIIH